MISCAVAISLDRHTNLPVSGGFNPAISAVALCSANIQGGAGRLLSGSFEKELASVPASSSPFPCQYRNQPCVLWLNMQFPLPLPFPI